MLLAGRGHNRHCNAAAAGVRAGAGRHGRCRDDMMSARGNDDDPRQADPLLDSTAPDGPRNVRTLRMRRRSSWDPVQPFCPAPWRGGLGTSSRPTIAAMASRGGAAHRPARAARRDLLLRVRVAGSPGLPRRGAFGEAATQGRLDLARVKSAPGRETECGSAGLDEEWALHFPADPRNRTRSRRSSTLTSRRRAVRA